MLSEMQDILAENRDVAAKKWDRWYPTVRPLRFRMDQSTKTGNDILMASESNIYYNSLHWCDLDSMIWPMHEFTNSVMNFMHV